MISAFGVEHGNTEFSKAAPAAAPRAVRRVVTGPDAYKHYPAPKAGTGAGQPKPLPPPNPAQWSATPRPGSKVVGPASPQELKSMPPPKAGTGASAQAKKKNWFQRNPGKTALGGVGIGAAGTGGYSYFNNR